MIKFNGIWLYGLSGVGKTYLSQIIYKNIDRSLIIDGDVVRKYISTDLNYSEEARNTQIKRIFGISKISINSNIFPIISSVWMNKNLFEICKKEKILLLKIERDMKEIIGSHKTYTENKKDVVGIDLLYENLDSLIYRNDTKNEFWKFIKTHIY